MLLKYSVVVLHLILVAADGIQADDCRSASWDAEAGRRNDSSCRTWHRADRSLLLSPAPNDTDAGLRPQLLETMSHNALPELFALDNYERCLSRPSGTYCLLDLDLANVPGQLYDYIMEYSAVSNKHYYRARLHRGVCVSERCNLDSRGVPAPSELLFCMNRTVFQESGVQVGNVKIQSCQLAQQSSPAPDALDKLVALILAMLVVATVLGTLHHLMLTADIVTENKYAMAFSAIKNWKVLEGGSKSDESEQFHALQGMRFLTMVIIISAHGFLIMAHGYLSNPEFIEQLYDDPIMRNLMNGRVIVQTFFVMSGFLLAYHCLKNMGSKPFPLAVLYKSTFNRCMRLLPSMLLMVGLSATWVPRLGSGPLWYLLVGHERDICRDNWWRNLLFVQNYFTFDRVCLPQTWYLAADTQLYILGVGVMMVLSRYKQRAGLLFSAVLAVSVAVPALQTYFQNMQPVRVSLFPEAFVNLFVDNVTFVNAYLSAQANWTGYTLGMLTAYIYHQARINSWDLRNSSVLRWSFYSSLPIGVWSVFLGAEFHSRTASSLESAMFNALDHNLFAAAMCVFILGCLFKCDSVLRSCVEWAPLQSLGRLSFCALLLHTAVLRTYIGHLPGLLHGSIYNIMLIVLGTTVITFTLSVPLFLMVEQPFCQLQKIFLGIEKKKSVVPLSGTGRLRGKAN